jgi:type II secretory pathway pseudopilin PulG
VIPQRSHGLSLLETVIALFVFLSAFTIVLTLFLRSNRALVEIEEKALSVAFAEAVVDDIRVWSLDYQNWDRKWADWSAVSLPAYPGYVARVTTTTPRLFTPCRQLEIDKPVAQQREMVVSFKDLEVTIENRGSVVFVFHTRIAEPEREIKGIEVRLNGGGTSLSANEKADYRAVLLDSNDDVVEDVSFHWGVEPDDGGNATVLASITDYAEAEIENVFVGADGVPRHITGQCRLEAVARYRGREYFGKSELVDILP